MIRRLVRENIEVELRLDPTLGECAQILQTFSASS